MSQFVEVKTAELAGSALDWAVAQVESEKYIAKHITKTSLNLAGQVVAVEHTANYRPSSDWAQGGPLIDKYNIWLSGPIGDRKEWSAAIDLSTDEMHGETALIALCRCIVGARLGDVVQVPAELVGVE